MTFKQLMLAASLAVAPVVLVAQAQSGLDPAAILKPLEASWPTFSGDYTGRRYSALKQITQANVKNLTLSWMIRVVTGSRGGLPPTIIGGVGTREFTAGTIKGAILAVDDVLYVTAPDNVWALDARDGRELWHFYWRTRGATHIGNRGAGMWHNYLFFETPDNYLVSLDAKTGQERWHVEIADLNQQYFSTPPPIIIGNHVIVGTGNDLDGPGFLQSFDPETGKLQWKFYTVPMNAGDPGLDTWPSLEAARYGGGHTWMPGSYDPATNLYIFGTGNPTPAYTGVGRPGDNLFTCSLIAINVDTGKMAWYYQTSPHDTHDWDSVQAPILIDATVSGKPRKLVSMAARNGYFFTVDRTTGEPIATTKYGTSTNWAKGINEKGLPVPDPAKEATIPGALVSPVEGGTTNWQPYTYSPQTGLFYTQEQNGFNMLYLSDPDPRGSMGLGGKIRTEIGSAPRFLTALDPATAKVVWRRPYANSSGGASGLLTTAGGLLFGGDGSDNFVAHDARTGKPLWHTRIGAVSNAPQTYLVDGRQYVLVATGDALWAFSLY
ncbi:MAG: acido-empty-quinoprotein group A [Vicinamibacterales bacterium]|nr:acido-empty-quinoprotein group A [Vicinamibacterales bacterium]